MREKTKNNTVNVQIFRAKKEEEILPEYHKKREEGMCAADEMSTLKSPKLSSSFSSVLLSCSSVIFLLLITASW